MKVEAIITELWASGASEAARGMADLEQENHAARRLLKRLKGFLEAREESPGLRGVLLGQIEDFYEQHGS